MFKHSLSVTHLVPPYSLVDFFLFHATLFSKSANIRIKSVSYYMLVTAVFLRMNLQENWMTSGLQNLVYCSVLCSWLYLNSHYWISWVVTPSYSKGVNTQSGSDSVKMSLRLDALCPRCRFEMVPPQPSILKRQVERQMYSNGTLPLPLPLGVFIV